MNENDEERGREKRDEGGALNGSLIKEKGGVNRRDRAGDEPGPPSHEERPRLPDENNRGGAERGLGEPRRVGSVAGDSEDRAEPVRVKRGGIGEPRWKELARRDPAGQRGVYLRVETFVRVGEARERADRRDVPETEGERSQKEEKGSGPR